MKDKGKKTKLVVFEAGNQVKWIALELKRLKGVNLHVGHPKKIRGISQRSGKTDKADAKKLAKLARGVMLPRAVPIVEGKVRYLRELVRARSTTARQASCFDQLHSRHVTSGKQEAKEIYLPRRLVLPICTGMLSLRVRMGG